MKRSAVTPPTDLASCSTKRLQTHLRNVERLRSCALPGARTELLDVQRALVAEIARRLGMRVI